MPTESVMETEIEAIITWLLDSTLCPTEYAPLAGAQAAFAGESDGGISATEEHDEEED